MAREAQRTSRMVAGASTPWVSVSLLSEGVFCDRAARFQYEESQEDTGEEAESHAVEVC